MLRAIKVKLYPTKIQSLNLEKDFNNCRVVYNLGLEVKIHSYKTYKKSISKYELINQLPNLKSEFEWLKSTKAEVLQNQFDNLETAFNKFFNGSGFPKFKNKNSKQSFIQKQNCKIKDNYIFYLKEKFKFKCSKFDTEKLSILKIKRITYSKENNRFYASILVEDTLKVKFVKSKNIIGIDLGLKEFLTDSNNNKISNPRFLRKSLKKLKTLQRRLANKKIGSNNRNKQKIKLSNLHEKIKNQRNNFLHNISTNIVYDNQVIIVESLKVKNMIKNKKLSLSISDVSWSSFVSMLEYKSKFNGRTFHKINTFYPSSKTCSKCGTIKQDLSLKDRIYKCENCKIEIDRDFNAAINIKNIGLKTLGMNKSEVKFVEKIQ
jgi:putative transposase